MMLAVVIITKLLMFCVFFAAAPYDHENFKP